MGKQAVTGLTKKQLEQIRRLKGKIQMKRPSREITHPDAVMWAVNNELERLSDD